MSETAAVQQEVIAQRSPWGGSIITGLSFSFLLVVLVGVAVGPRIAPHRAETQRLFSTLQHPNSEFFLGTDYLGRDVLSLIIVGARSAILGPLIIAIAVMVIGNSLGVLAGYSGGWLDSTVMRVVDLLYALPGMLVAIVAVGILGGGYAVSVATFIILFSPASTRIARAAALAQRSLPYLEAAQCLGLPALRIMVLHVWLNITPIVLAHAVLNFAAALVALSSLSFLGLGVPPGDADWGRMLADNRVYLLSNPISVLAPGLMIVLTATSMNLIGDWLQERLADKGRAR
jgi:peptide/nickel transport system permease protein